MAIKRAIKAGNKSIISFKKTIKVGEITQLLDKSTYPATATVKGVTFTNNGDGSFTFTGTTSDNDFAYRPLIYKYPLKKDHIYYCPIQLLSIGTTNSYVEFVVWDIGTVGDNQVYPADGTFYKVTSGNRVCRIGLLKYGTDTTPHTVIPQLFDLTEMFGAGHEPATVAEFKEKFPETYYPYQRAVLTVYNKVVRPCAKKGEVVQLLDKSKYYGTQTNHGITATNNGDGSWTINGTATKAGYINFSPALTSIIGGHKILICGNKENSNFKMGLLNQPIRDDTGTGAIGIFNQSAAKTWGIEWANGVVINNVTIYPQLFDLTAMYGAGNEPKTLADFRKDFPESYYPYSPIQTKNLLKMVINDAQYNATSRISGDVWTIIPKNSGGYGQLKAHLPAGTYTLSGVICNNNEFSTKINYTILSEAPNAGNIFALGYLQNNLTFTLDKEKDFYILLYPAFGIDNSLGVYRKAWYKLQIEKGSVATDYVPHDYI